MGWVGNINRASRVKVSTMNAAANVAFRAGRWPIQALVFITTFAFVMYIAVVELKPGALPTSLARTFVVDALDRWHAYDSSDTHDVAVASSLPKFVGAPVLLPNDAPAGVRDIIDSFAAQHDTKFSHLAHLGLHPGGLVGAMVSSATEPLTHLVLPAHLYPQLLDELSVFEVGGETWELQSAPSWLVYSRFYYQRIVELLHTATYFDITVMTLGWLGMYYTFFQLFRQMKALGSRTFLFLAALMSASLSFSSAYAITIVAGMHVPKLALVQGLPFFVLAVGFNNKVSLAREALLNPASDIGAAEAVSDAVSKLFMGFCRESVFLAAGILCAGIATRTTVPSLFNFSVLSALILALDLVFLVTFFAANVSLKAAMVRVERNDNVRRALQEDGVARDVADAYADEVLHSSTQARAARFTHFRYLGGSLRLLLVFVLMLVNWLHIVKFPISFMVSRADLVNVDVADFMHRTATPCLLTVVPALRFSRAGPAAVFVNSLVSILRSAAATRAGLLALVLSIICNGYLVSLVMRQGSTPLVVKVVGARRNTLGEKSKAELKQLETLQEQLRQQQRKIALLEKAGSVVVNDNEEAIRPLEECSAILRAGDTPTLSNEELIALSVAGILPLYALEKQLKDTTRAVAVRRAAVSRLSSTQTLEHSELPYKNYNYDRVLGACCENVVGYLPLPLGVAGPVIIDGKEYYLPMATTEGVLVASTMRGCKALNSGGGVSTEILGDGMTRGPCVTFATASRTATCKIFLDSEEGKRAMEQAFNSTSRFARLTALKTAQAGVFLYIRFRAQTGDAMGMNMISKGTERALQVLAEKCGFEDMTIVSVSGNYCTDKKAAAVNWIDGRGKSVVAEAIVPGDKVQSILKTSVDELVELNMAKNLLGSAVAGVMGGFNAHAANLVAALFLATGQDPAQVVEGSNCMTLMSNVDGDLQISVTMPSLEVGTIGGGTILEPQAAMLNMLGVRGPHLSTPGENARQLARIVATAVLAGELSLNSALAAGHLVKSHMAHNRAKPAPSQ